MSDSYATEQDLCAAFTERCVADGLAVYAETGGFDMLVVYPDGRQLGVEAKLRLNEKVLSQILPSPWLMHERGPHHRAILIPKAVDGSPYLDLLAYVGLDVITATRRSYYDRARHCYLPRPEFGIAANLHDWNPVKPCKLPEYVPDVIGGSSGPVKLTEWKIAALKIMADLELDGFVTRDNFKRHGIDYRRWTATDGWLRSRGNGEWVNGSAGFHLQHPTVYAQILEKARGERVSA
jgi:hypothetical protein